MKQRCLVFLVIIAASLLGLTSPGRCDANHPRSTEQELKATLKGLWKGRDFRAIDELYQVIVKEKERFEPFGQWKIRAFHSENSMCAGEVPCAELVDEWKKKDPKCVECRFVKSSLLYMQAWRVRGGGFVSAKADSSLVQYRMLMEQSWNELMSLEKTAAADPDFHYKRLRAAHELGAPKKVTDRYYEEAIAIEPDYFELHDKQLHYSLPRWGGAPGEIRKVAERAAEANRATMGDSYYALLAVEAYGAEYEDMFSRHGFSWPRIKQAFEDLLNIKNTRENIAKYAMLALVAEDRETSRAQFAKLGQWDESISSVFTQRNFESWKNDALGEPRKESPLVKAIKRGDKAEIERLLNSGTSVNVKYSPDDAFYDSLGAALEFHPELFDYLLSKGADIKLCRSGSASCLTLAVDLGRESIVKVLLDQRPNPPSGPELLIAASENFAGIVRMLMNAKASANGMTGPKRVTPLMAGARANALESAIIMLQEPSTRVNMVDADGHAALHYAAGAGQVAMVKLLLKHGADPLQPAEGKTAAQIARARGYTEAADLLDAEEREAAGGTPLMTVIKRGDRAAVEALLADSGLRINEARGEHTALTLAVRYHPEFVDMLLKKNAMPGMGTIEGKRLVLYAVQMKDIELTAKLAKKDPAVGFGSPSAMSEAIRMNSPELIRALLSHPIADPNNVGGFDTSLTLAAKLNAVEATEELLKHPRIRVSQRVFGGAAGRFDTPLSIAKEKGHTKLVELLEKSGAKE